MGGSENECVTYCKIEQWNLRYFLAEDISHGNFNIIYEDFFINSKALTTIPLT